MNMLSNLQNLQKINWGTIHLLPQICVNRFGKFVRSDVNWNRSKAFFLTHHDDDLMYDVINKDFLAMLDNDDTEHGPRLFMHKLVFSYLKYWLSNLYDPKRGDFNEENVMSILEKLMEDKKLVMLEICQPIDLQFTSNGGSLIKVTPLSAGSEVGSIMLLLETELNSEMVRVLYTGNCRLIRKDYSECKPLHNPDGTPKSLNKIYVDTTYCLPTVQELPCRAYSVFKLTAALDKYKHTTGLKLRFNITGGQSGQSRRALYHIAEEFGEQIHVPKGLLKHLRDIPEVGLRFICPDEDWLARRQFHYGCSFDNSCNNENQSPQDKEILVELGCEISRGSDIFAITEPQFNWLKELNTTFFTEFGNIQQLYVSHLSRFELGRLINYFNLDCKDVLPLYKARRMPISFLKLLIRTTCQQVQEVHERTFVRHDVYSTWYDCTNLVKSKVLKGPLPAQVFTFQ